MHTCFSISCSRSLSSLCQRWYSSKSSSLSLISVMLFLRSRVYGFVRLCSLLEDPATVMHGIFLWLWGLVRGDELDREPRPGMTAQPGVDLHNCLAPGSLSNPGNNDGAMSFWGPWGLLGIDLGVKPCDVREKMKPCDPGFTLLLVQALRGGSSLVDPDASGVLSLWGKSTWDGWWSLIGLGDLFCREEPFTRGLDGAVWENLTGAGMGLEFPDPLLSGVMLDVVSALKFLRSFGLSWGIWSAVAPPEATESEVRGRGTGVELAWDTLASIGGVLFPRLWPRVQLLFSKMKSFFIELFFPFSMFDGEGWWIDCLPDSGDDDESWMIFAMLFVLKSLLLEMNWWFPFKTLWGSAEGDRNTCAWAFLLNKGRDSCKNTYKQTQGGICPVSSLPWHLLHVRSLGQIHVLEHVVQHCKCPCGSSELVITVSGPLFSCMRGCFAPRLCCNPAGIWSC